MPKSLQGAEIFAIGQWNGKQFTSEDLDSIVASFTALGLSGRVPLKLGHDGEDARFDDGVPALGWVTRVWREGSKLFADFVDIPTVVYEAIKNGLYKFVSVELLRDVPADTRKIPWVLDAVALLGATQPAVGILRDLQSLTLTRGTGLPCFERVMFQRAADSFFSNQFTESQAMSEKDKTPTPNVAELFEKINDLSNKLTALSESNARLKGEVQEGQQFKRRFEELQENHSKERREAHRKAIKERFERAVERKIISSAARERFYKFHGVEDSDQIERISFADVDEYIAENPNPYSGRSKTRTLEGTGDDRELIGALPDEETRVLSLRYCKDHGLDPTKTEHLERAAMAVFRDNPGLAERYRMLPDDFASGRLE